VLIDVISRRIPGLEELYAFLGRPDLETIRFEFTPDLLCVEYQSRVNPDDDVCFLQGDLPLPLPAFSVPATSRG
jgi:hypothetical protein